MRDRWMSLRWAGGLFLAVGLAGCPDGDPTDPAVDWPDPKPYQVVGDQGSIVVARLDRPDNPRLDVFGMFGDDLQGYTNSAACASDFMPCVTDGPRIPYGDVAFLSTSVFDPTRTSFSWVGDEMMAGSVVAPFAHDPEAGLVNYAGGSEQRPEGRIRVRLGGEWTDLDIAMGFYPPDFTVTGPSIAVDQRLDLSGAPIEFTWDSLGGREIWLWAQGSTSRRLIRVPDTGSYTLQPFELGLAPAEKVEIGLAAVTTEQLDVDGNQLDLMVLTGAGWTGSVCGDFLDVPVENTPPGPFEMTVPAFMGYGFNGILDEGIRDFRDPDTGELRSAELYFNFYDENFTQLCTIRYDASEAARRDPLLLDSDAEQYATFRVGLFNGDSSCGQIDPTELGFSDLRNYLEQFDWSFSIGDLTELEEPLSEAYGEEQWAQQGDFFYGVFWSQDGLFGQERGYGYHTALPTCFQGSLSSTYRAPDDELNDGYYITFPYYIDRL